MINERPVFPNFFEEFIYLKWWQYIQNLEQTAVENKSIYDTALHIDYTAWQLHRPSENGNEILCKIDGIQIVKAIKA